MSKQKWKHIIRRLALVAPALILLGGCASRDPNSTSYKIIAGPFNHLIEWAAGLLNGNYGLALILVVLVIKILLTPLTLGPQRNTIRQQEIMKGLQPYLEDYQTRMENASSQAEQLAIQQEQMAFIRENGLDMKDSLKSGCLPLLIQLPIINGLYIAVYTNESIANYTFMGIKLGDPSYLLSGFTVLLYCLQAYMAYRSTPSQAQNLGKSSMYQVFMGPILLGIVIFRLPAGLNLYFATSAVWSLVESLYIKKVYQPRLEKEIKEELSNKEIKIRKPTPQYQASSSTVSQADQTSRPKRNERKQNRKK